MSQHCARTIRTASLIALPFALMALAPAAHALSMTASNNWALNGGPMPGSPLAQSTASSGSVDIGGGDYSGTSSIFYHTYGNDSGNFGSRSSGVGFFNIDGEYSFEESYAASNTSFSFHVVPGELGFSNSSSFTGSEHLNASYFLDILLNGTSIWSSGATLDQVGSTLTFNQSGTNLGAYTAGSYQYLMNDYTNTLTLTDYISSFNTTGTNTIKYVLTTHAFSDVSTCTTSTSPDSTGTPPKDPTNPDIGNGATGSNGSYNICPGAVARIGDPFNVPEPGTIALLGLGLAGLGYSRRRKV